MFALGIRYLNGWSMAAADGARKEQAEWPPHPDRVFMALAAAWFETDEDVAEGEALRWLETLPPPAIAASGATTRSAVVSYVPVNDAGVGRKMPTGGDLGKLKDAGLAVLPEYRLRQPRGFPVAIPHGSNGASGLAGGRFGCPSHCFGTAGRQGHACRSFCFPCTNMAGNQSAGPGVDSGNRRRNSAPARHEPRALENTGNTHEPHRLERLSGYAQ